MNGAVAVIVITDGIMNSFKKNNALGPDRAKTKAELNIRSSLIFNRLVSRGILISVSGDRYYMDVPAQERYLKRRRLTSVIVAALIVTIAIILAFFWR
jgi:hypothetical protein